MKSIKISQTKDFDYHVAYDDGTFDIFKGIRPLDHPPTVWHLPTTIALVEDEDTFQVWELQNPEACEELSRYLIASDQPWITDFMILNTLFHTHGL